MPGIDYAAAVLLQGCDTQADDRALKERYYHLPLLRCHHLLATGPDVQFMIRWSCKPIFLADLLPGAMASRIIS